MKNSVILDDFPRSVEHLKLLDIILRRYNKKIHGVIYLNISEAQSIARIKNRVICASCQSIFNKDEVRVSEGKCNNCESSQFTSLCDVNEEELRQKYHLYIQKSKVLLDEWRRRDLLFVLDIQTNETTPGAGGDMPHLPHDTVTDHLKRIENKILEIMCNPERFYSPSVAHTLLSSPISYTQTAKKLLHVMKHTNNLTDVAPERLKAILRSFRNDSLTENDYKRTGVMRRFIYLCTNNFHKYKEFVRVFDRYGVEVLQMPSLDEVDINANLMKQLLLEKTKDLVPLAILKEESLLLSTYALDSHGHNRSHSEVSFTTTERDLEWLRDESIPRNNFKATLLSSRRDGVLATHRAILQAWSIDPVDKEMKLKEYVYETKGRMRYSATIGEYNTNIVPVFGWDDDFVLLSTNKSYYEHYSQHGHAKSDRPSKVSSRDMVISSFLSDFIYYKQLKNLKHKPLMLNRVVDFRVDVSDFIRKEVLYVNEWSRKFRFWNMLHHVCNEGIFFKGADTRLEANYWQPGLNAGLPLISKQDNIHELTFMFHDLGHFLMKDLIFIGNQDTLLTRRTYIIHRMISEAVTIMLADGLFIRTLELNENVKYDYSERKIYPLFRDTGLEFEPPEEQAAHDEGNNDAAASQRYISNIRKILKASVDYTVKGEDSTFRELITRHHTNTMPRGGVNSEEASVKNATSHNADSIMKSLNKYQLKFQPFFVSDLQWTSHNYNNMSSRTHEMKFWWRLTLPLREILERNGLPLETIEEFISNIRRRASAKQNAPFSDETPNYNRIEDPQISVSDLVDIIFDAVFRDRIFPIFSQPSDAISLLPAHIRLYRSFIRYMIGQLGIFARFWSYAADESKFYYNQIVTLFLAEPLEIVEQKENVTGDEKVIVEVSKDNKNAKNLQCALEFVDRVRSTYEEYVTVLANKSIISIDDMHNFVEIYPLFEPFYVTYDKDSADYPDLKLLVNSILSVTCHRRHQISDMERFINRKMTSEEIKYYNVMTTLVEACNGQVEDGAYVTRSGVLLLARTDEIYEGAPDLLQFASVLISGITVETSLEICLHTRGFGASFTSSRMSHLSVPLYLIQEDLLDSTLTTSTDIVENESVSKDQEVQIAMKEYLKLMQIYRTSYEHKYSPQKRWGAGGGSESGSASECVRNTSEGSRLFNATQCASKCSFGILSMTLQDWNHLFQNCFRMTKSNIQLECLNVLYKMCLVLHGEYPSAISSPLEYATKDISESTTEKEEPFSPKLTPSLRTCLGVKLTLNARKLLLLLNLKENREQDCTDEKLLTEFTSRISQLHFDA